MPTGQCDGLADAAYPGSGVDQHCAFGDYRFLWDDQSYGNHAWVIAGGDTVIVDMASTAAPMAAPIPPSPPAPRPSIPRFWGATTPTARPATSPIARP